MNFISKKLLIFFLFSAVALTASEKKSLDSTAEPVIVVIPVAGTVDAGMASYISRTLRDASKYPDRVIVLEMDTFGGEVDAAFQIVDTLVNVKVPTIAYVKTKAISAGALIALACNRLVMKHNTTLGDVAPLTYSQEGPKMLGEKFQSPIRAKFRTLAKRNGYPEKLTEAMVTEGLVIYEVKLPDTTMFLDSTGLADLPLSTKKKIVSTNTVVKKGELLTMDDSEAHRLGFSRMSVSSIEEMAGKLGYNDAKIVRLKETWSETAARFISMIAPILMIIGFAALYIEIKTPGFGAPGIIGIICLALVFFGQYMVGLADYTELLLLLTGIALIIIELFVIPGFGWIGFAGIALVIAGMVLSFQSFVIPRPDFPWQTRQLINNIITVLGSMIGSALLAVLFFRFVFVKVSTIVKGPYLQATLQDAHVDSGFSSLPHIGDKGVVLTPLRPSGKARINGDVFDVVSEGEFVEKNVAVKVDSISGNRIVVVKEIHD